MDISLARVTRSLLCLGVAGALLVAVLAPQASATPNAAGRRIAGNNRYETSQAIARDAFSEVGTAIVASGDSFPDALAAAYLAGAFDSPIVLTERHRLSGGTVDTLRAIGATDVTVIGGEVAVADTVLDELRAAGFEVQRLSGVNRYETAAAVATSRPATSIGTFRTGRAAILATGDSFADALAAGPLAFAGGLPLLLTSGTSVREEARQAMSDLRIEQVIVVGGTGTIPETVVTELRQSGMSVDRIAGDTRQGTAAELARVLIAELDFAAQEVHLVRGDLFADALAAGPRGGTLGAPVLLADNSTSLGDEAIEVIDLNSDTVQTVVAVGGPGVLDQQVINEGVGAARRD